MPSLRYIAGVAVLLVGCLMQPAAAAEGRFVYRLRGEIRLLLFWIGRDNVGGGWIDLSRSGDPTAARWTQEIELLFGSDPERIANRINRWGYGREASEWVREPGNPASQLESTEFHGIMVHSPEASIDEALANTKQAAGSQRFLYDGIRSKVLPKQATSELRVLTENEEFHYLRPEALLAKFAESLRSVPPLRQKQFLNETGLYGAPYGFLTGLSHLIQQAIERPGAYALTFAYNATPYSLEVLSVKQLASFETRFALGPARYRDIALIRFRCFNTVKHTRTDFSLWIPMTGSLNGIPVRILLQPRWWLRLQMDLDPKTSQFGPPS